MRVALYHPWIYVKGGVERCLVELVRRSRHEWTLFTHHFDPDATFPEMRDLPVVELSPKVSVRRGLAPLARAAVTIASTRLPPDAGRALLVSSESLGDFVLARTRLPSVAYCHTPLKILHDPVTRAALTRRDRRRAVVRTALGPAFSAFDRRMWRRYRHAFVNGAETRERIARAGLSPAGPVEVLHPGVDPERFSYGAEPREEFFLVPGRVMWQKNIELALDALAAARAQGLRSTFVVAGMVDEKSRPYLSDLRDRAAGLPVWFELAPTDERLAELYRRCLAVIFPPANEDFGIVPLEAMASGAPVIAVNAGGPKESVQHEVTGWLVPPIPRAISEKMLQVERAGESLRSMREAARARALVFGWDRFAQRIDDVLESVAQMQPTDSRA